jgi:aspartyl-tRNA(Asn)/glutamyl-tRNA(Gln) amidotransferase subunit A
LSVHELTAYALREKVLNGEASAEGVVWDLLDRIEARDGEVRAYLTVDREGALRQGEEIDRRVRQGERPGALAGVPVAVKDVLCTKGLRTTCGSRILHNFIPPYDATCVARIRAAGGVIIGKTNCDEFAMGSSTENSGFFPTRNPHDPERVPGGSSGGSAAAVAAGEAFAALGTDTGGSIRQPASFCGVVGLKPTYGRVSRYGLVAYASSLDQAGPMTKDVRDAALLLSAIAGCDAQDATSADVPATDYVGGLARGVEGLRVGLPKEYFAEGLDPEVKGAVMRAAGVLERAGATPCEVSLPVAGHPEYAISAYYIVAMAEASANLARFDGVKYGRRAEGVGDLLEMYCKTRSEGFGQEVKRRIMLGTYALSAGYYDAYYLKAQKVRTLIKRDFEKASEACDLILSPVAPTPAFRVGEKVSDPLQMYLSDIYTVAINLAGIPGISVPCGRSSSGLPIGAQILGRPFEEDLILRAAYAVEQGISAHEKK